MKDNKSITSATTASLPIILKRDLPSQTIDVLLLKKEKDAISNNSVNHSGGARVMRQFLPFLQYY